jgi:hypothetical protein
MAWLFADSFDFYAAIADAAAGHWDSSASWSISSTTRFSVGRAYQNGANANTTFLSKATGSNDATVFFAVAFYYSAALSGTVAALGLQLLDATTAQCTVVFESSGNIVLKSGGANGTVLATYTSAFAQSVWAHFQIKVVINNTTGSISVRKNGATSDSYSASSLNTRGGTSNNYANKVAIVSGNTGSSTPIVDDLLVFNDSGAAPNTWVGDVRALQLMPSGDTAQKDFSRSTGSTNCTLVDEAQQNGDTDYVFSSTSGQEDLYDLADLTATPTSIIGVQSRMFAKKSDTGSRQGQIRVKSGATEVGGTDTALSTSYAWLNRVDTVDPNTSAAWTASAVNALQVGPKCTA